MSNLVIEMPRSTQKPSRQRPDHERRQSGRRAAEEARWLAAAIRSQGHETQLDLKRDQIVDLLRRGAGVTQILREISAAHETPSSEIGRALELRRTLQLVEQGAPEVDGLAIGTADMRRILAYLDTRILALQRRARRLA